MLSGTAPDEEGSMMCSYRSKAASPQLLFEEDNVADLQ